MKPPQYLEQSTRLWFTDVVETYELAAHHIKLLTLAAESWDRCQQARRAIDEFGLTYMDRFDQPHSRPEISIERDSRIAYARLIRELALDVEAPTETRPPRRPGT